MYLGARCLFRIEKREPSFVAQVVDGIASLPGAEEIGPWNVVVQVLTGELQRPHASAAASSTSSNAPVVASAPPAVSSAQKPPRYICIKDNALDVPLVLHASTHLPLAGQEALLALLQVTVKQEFTMRGKRFRWVDEEEMDWEIGVGSGPPQAGPKNTLYLSIQMAATRSRVYARLELFLRILPRIVGEDAASIAVHFHHTQPASISPLVASTTYNRAHLTLQYVTMLQNDIQSSK